MDTMRASLTVRLVVPVLLLMVAVSLTAMLEAAPVATPFEPEAFEIVAVAVSLEVHATSRVMSLVAPLSKVPVAVNG